MMRKQISKRTANNPFYCIPQSREAANIIADQQEGIMELKMYLRKQILSGLSVADSSQMELPSVVSLALGLRCQREDVLNELEDLKLLGYNYTMADLRTPILVVDTLLDKVI